MKKLNVTPSIIFDAEIRLRSASELPIRKGITKGYSASLKFADEYFPAQIISCDTEISPGEKGSVVIVMLRPRQLIDMNTEFLVTEGPTLTVGTGYVTSKPKLYD